MDASLELIETCLGIVGRTGYMHAWEAEGIQPDIQCVAKTLGSGYAAISAVLMNQRVSEGIMGGKAAFVNGTSIAVLHRDLADISR